MWYIWLFTDNIYFFELTRYHKSSKKCRWIYAYQEFLALPLLIINHLNLKFRFKFYLIAIGWKVRNKAFWRLLGDGD